LQNSAQNFDELSMSGSNLVGRSPRVKSKGDHNEVCNYLKDMTLVVFNQETISVKIVKIR
jgi:hypothetical protein